MSKVSSTSACDFFISRTGVDAEWAEWIAWTLEEAGYHIYLQDWDFRPGRSFIREMQKGATNCRRTVAVLSPSYFESAFSSAEWEAALTKDPTGTDRALVTVRVAQCNPPGLLARYPYIDLFGRDEATARDVLLAGVAEGRRKPEQKPSFPAHPPSRSQAPGFPVPERNRGTALPSQEQEQARAIEVADEQGAAVDGLPTWKKNKVFEAIQAAGLSPEEFVWGIDGDDSCLRHRSSKAYFVFGGNASKYVVRYAAGDVLEGKLEKYSWAALMDSVGVWLRDVKQDKETPDLWAKS